MEEIVFKAMGTAISLAIVLDKAQILLTEAMRRLLDYEERFSANDSDSLLMQVNAKAEISHLQVNCYWQRLFFAIRGNFKYRYLTPGQIMAGWF